MFWRRGRADTETLHLAHQMLLKYGMLDTAQDLAGWSHIRGSLDSHAAVVRGRRNALPNRTMDVVVPLVTTLCQDLARRGTVSVLADLRKSKPEKITAQRQLPVRRPVRKAVEWYLIDPWLRIRMELADRSVLLICVTDRIRYRQINKVSPSGKHKRKTKTKQVQLIRVSRTLPWGTTGRQPTRRPPAWIRVAVRDRGRRTVLATAKLGGIPTGAEQGPLILTTVAEVFRWTARPPAGGDRTTRSGS